jgi:hypothetical protein
MKVIKIGIMSQKEIRECTLAIARGEYMPRADEPKIWITSTKTNLKKLQQETDKGIDYKDCPETTEEFWEDAKIFISQLKSE